jgi:DNA-binding Xre family transcriptional regulator
MGSTEPREDNEMNVATLAAPAKWDAKEYRRMVSATYRDGNLLVLFEDGTWVDLRADRLMSPEARGVQWERLSVSPYEITVPTENSEVEIPWSTVRAVTDREYSAHLADAADEEARQIGQRIRELRESRNLSSREVAERAGIAPQSLSRIELGRHDVVFTTLQRILAAMGCSLKDLAGQPLERATGPSTKS